MAISISNYPVYLQDGRKLDRDCLKSQESQNEGRKVFDRDSLEVSPLSKNREIIMDRIKHTVVQSAASLSNMRAGILKQIGEEKGQYGYSEVVNCPTLMINMFSPKRKAASVMRNTGSRFGSRLMRILQKGSSRINLKGLTG